MCRVGGGRLAGSGAATWTLCALCLCCGLQTCGLCEGWVVCILCADVIVCVSRCGGRGEGDRGGSLGSRPGVCLGRPGTCPPSWVKGVCSSVAPQAGGRGTEQERADPHPRSPMGPAYYACRPPPVPGLLLQGVEVQSVPPKLLG